MRTQIGTMTLTEETTYRQANFATASWSQDVTVQPGTYPVMATVREDGKVVDFPGPSVKLPGIVSNAHFPVGFGKQYIANTRDADKNGQPATHVISPYAHAVAKAIVTGEGHAFDLDEGFEAVAVDFVSSVDGKNCRTYNLRRVSTENDRKETS